MSGVGQWRGCKACAGAGISFTTYGGKLCLGCRGTGAVLVLAKIGQEWRERIDRNPRIATVVARGFRLEPGGEIMVRMCCKSTGEIFVVVERVLYAEWLVW